MEASPLHSSSLLLGEETALSILRDQAQAFNEKFTVELTKFDGTTARISDQQSCPGLRPKKALDKLP